MTSLEGRGQDLYLYLLVENRRYGSNREVVGEGRSRESSQVEHEVVGREKSSAAKHV